MNDFECWVNAGLDAASVGCNGHPYLPGITPIIIALLGIGAWYILIHYMITGEFLPDVLGGKS